ncbi:hypothetical protein AVEN_146451-1 [Araneus ventricosus]|uniref:Uncharacterized protein n=1 Tax=Araneus ventricosus TaxID=182803 RepID=A0A4Y2NV70_ARAVE|nr:hypothetical protein AVEN_146451-1 [Araneus ventricosus]
MRTIQHSLSATSLPRQTHTSSLKLYVRRSTMPTTSQEAVHKSHCGQSLVSYPSIEYRLSSPSPQPGITSSLLLTPPLLELQTQMFHLHAGRKK